MRRTAHSVWHASALWLGVALIASGAESNLIKDPSFENPKSKDQFGHVFADWGGWKYEGDCDFRVGDVAHSGRHSCLLYGVSAPKIRVSQPIDLEPGRYQITAYLRGLDIGAGPWNQTTEFMFGDKYLSLKKNGVFGWTKLTYVGELTQKAKTGPSFGLMAPGYFWIDDVSMVKVGGDTPLTPEPVLGKEEAPIAPPGELSAAAVRCSECGYRNEPKWGTCYACGTRIEAKGQDVATGPTTKLITSFEDRSPFSGGTVVEGHATDGARSLRIDKDYVSLDAPEDWRGYDFIKADLETAAKEPIPFTVEVTDTSTKDYWTRVNYTTIIPPGKSVFVLPVKQLYVGEKSRPGRMLDLANVKRLVFNIGSASAPVFLDNLRLERDDTIRQLQFDGLYAFDLGTSTSPVMDGFTPLLPSSLYSRGRGYGLKDARVWRALDALQPDPLYQDFICIESGGLAVDVPNGTYRVFVNIDSPSGFWGEYQTYRHRAVLAEGREVVNESMDFNAFKDRYYRFWNTEDRPDEATFDKYQKPYFHEKTFDVDVKDGQLNLEFQGENWACSVSAIVIFPVAKAAEGQKFLNAVEARRRFYFDNYFKRILPRPVGDPLKPSANDQSQGFVVFSRDVMHDVNAQDTPLKSEVGGPLKGEGFAGEYGPVTLALTALKDLGQVHVTVSDLTGPAGSIPTRAVDVGSISNRLSRVTMEGTVYTISPRLLMPGGTADAPKGFARRFWLTVQTPGDAKPGIYKGTVGIRTEKAGHADVPIEYRVRAGKLDDADIPVGPFGCSIGTPWYGDDPAASEFHAQLFDRSLRKLREYGFTSCTGLPSIAYRGVKDGKAVLDFTQADPAMRTLKDLGFLAVVTYGGGVTGINAYDKDEAQMKAAGFTSYPDFIRAVYTPIQLHATQQGWMPVYYNLGDEPLGDAAIRSAENAEAYRAAFPKGPPWFTAASSFKGTKADDPHFRLSKALHVATWNDHDEDGVKLLHDAGSEWAFYNGGNRWTFGTYMYKAAKQFGMKYRLSWHWSAVAGDPYYALDCREDDYAWCNSTPDGKLIPSVEFERLREGLGDYLRLLTLDRLARQKSSTPAGQAGRKLIDTRLAAFHLGQRDHDALFPPSDWVDFRHQLDDAIEALR